MALPGKPSVLIVCYNFPPYPGVGGRRWAKFSRLLAERGHDVFVISSENPYQKNSEWTEDVKDLTVIQLPLKYPKSLILYPTGLFGRVRYRVDLFFVKLGTKRNYYDRAVFWKKQLTSKMEALINEKNIATVIVSGAPFSLFSYVSDIKKALPHLNLIGDIRDPWTNNKTAYAFDTLSPSRRAYEEACERTVFRNFNRVTTVNDHITNYFKTLYKGEESKFTTVENGFDPGEILFLEDPTLDIDKDKMNLVFSGSFYDKAFYLLDNLVRALQEKDPVTLKKIHFYFFGANSDAVKRRVAGTGVEHLFTFGNYNNIQSVNWLISKVDYCMLFLTDDINYSFSTKFCEYIKLKKPVVVFSKKGLTGEFVEQHHIGFHVDNGHEAEFVNKLLAGDKTVFPIAFDTSQFSVEKLVLNYEQMIK